MKTVNIIFSGKGDGGDDSSLRTTINSDTVYSGVSCYYSSRYVHDIVSNRSMKAGSYIGYHEDSATTWHVYVFDRPTNITFTYGCTYENTFNYITY